MTGLMTDEGQTIAYSAIKSVTLKSLDDRRTPGCVLFAVKSSW